MDRQDWEFYLSAPLSMERRIFKKKKKNFFSEGHRGYYAKDLPIYLRYCVFIREIWVPLRNETVETGHWAHCSRTGNDNRRCAQHSGHFVTHFASSAATIPSHHYCRPIQFTRFIFFSPPLPSFPLDTRNRFADESIGNKITYLWTDGYRETRSVGNLDICQVFLPSNFKLRSIVYFYFNFQRNFRILWRKNDSLNMFHECI